MEKYGYSSTEVSAKTGDKVYDSIKDFGIAIAKAKMEKLGMSWFGSGVSNTTSSVPNQSTTSEPAAKP